MTTPDLTGLLDQALQAERLGRFDEARSLLRQVVAAGDELHTLDAQLRLGKLLILGGAPNADEAVAVLTAARTEAERVGSLRLAATAIHLLALLARHSGQLDEALALLRDSPASLQKGLTGPTLGQYFHYRGLVEADRGEFNYAERMLFRAHQMYQEGHYNPGLAEVCDSLANLLLKRGKSRAALTFARRSLALKRKLGDRLGEAITLGTIGRAYLLHARYDEAALAFRQDLEIARELGDERGIGIMLNSLAEVELLQNRLEGAAKYYQQNLDVDRGPYNAFYSQMGLARVHLAANRPDEARSCADAIAQIIDEGLQFHGLPDALTGLRGGIAWRKGDLETGVQMLEQAIESLVERNQPMDTINLLYDLRDLYQSQGQKAKAVEVMARALDILSECGSERGVEDVEQWLRSVDSPGLTRLALERHFPSWLVEDILGGRMKQPPTRKQEIAVLFSDVRGYTTLSEGLPPEQVVELLNEWFGEATRAIRRHGGTVDKFIGDAVMALFGVPEPREDAAANAVRAALEMRDALSAMNLRQKALGGREILVGIGIDTGEAVVGYIGSHLRRSYTAIGDAVNTASRLESATKDYPGCDILISERTEQGQHKAGVAETTFLGNAELKGKGEKVAVYQVLGLREPRSEGLA